ncbi:MAG: sugar kinase [Chloroflexota bacterium]
MAEFVTFGETMLRDTPADHERLERTRRVDVSLGGSELAVAVLLARLGISTRYITRAPDNPYGWLLRNTAREQGVDTEHFAWADKSDLFGRYLYELGRTPRPGTAWYQRKFSAASQLAPGMVDWAAALRDAHLLHTSGITFGLSAHSGYTRNYLLESFHEALDARPPGCLVGVDFNYRATLWPPEQCKAVMTPVLREHTDVLITSIHDMRQFYGIGFEKLENDRIPDLPLKAFLRQVQETFCLKFVAVTLRHADSNELQRWESAALDAGGCFYRSAEARPMAPLDRLGGGDAWVGGFYYGLLAESDPAKALETGVQVGDAATRLKQTLMYDLPVLTWGDIQALLAADKNGAGANMIR